MSVLCAAQEVKGFLFFFGCRKVRKSQDRGPVELHCLIFFHAKLFNRKREDLPCVSALPPPCLKNLLDLMFTWSVNEKSVRVVFLSL